MSRICEMGICNKKPRKVTRRKLLRGNYNPTSKRTQNLNLQWYRLSDGTRVKVCTTCIRTLNKNQVA